MSQNRERDESRSASVDGRLRRALETDASTVRRVVRHALDETTTSDPGPRYRWGTWAVAAAVVVIAVTAVTLRGLSRWGDERPSAPLITNASGELVLILPDVPNEPAANRPDRSDETPIIFNHSRVIAAIVPGVEPRFVISGGGS